MFIAGAVNVLMVPMDMTAPLNGAGGDQALVDLGMLLVGVTSAGVFGRWGLSLVGRRVDAWTTRREEARHRALRQAAEELGMVVEHDLKDGHPIFVGKRRSVWLRLHLTRTPHLIASHRLPLPAGFRLAAGFGGEVLGNAVLDAVLKPENTDRMTVDWSDAALTGLLLEALHGHPGSALDATTLKLHSIDSEDLSAALDLSCELVEALREQGPQARTG